MADGYKKAGDYDFADLDEWLCEYVDGTIDPVVCKALEEYMQQNPELASHVERLQEARLLLCQYGCSYQAPHGLQPRLRRRLATEIIEESQPVLGGSGIHLISLATITSVVAIILIFAIPSESVTQDSIQRTASPQFIQPEINLQFPMNNRATPLPTLTDNVFFSRFTSQPVSRKRPLSPAVHFPLYDTGIYPASGLRSAEALIPASP